MITRCEKCGRVYDDASCWTICPHGPLWASPTAYCRIHDLVNCPHCKAEPIVMNVKSAFAVFVLLCGGIVAAVLAVVIFIAVRYGK